MESIFGVETMKSFRRRRPADWVCLLAAFECRKRAADALSPSPLNIALPFAFIEFYRKLTVRLLSTRRRYVLFCKIIVVINIFNVA